MQSVTSYSENPGGTTAAAVQGHAVNGWFNLTLMQKNLSRFWPLWALYIVIWLLMWPLVQSIQVFGRNSWYQNTAELAESIADYTLGVGVIGGIAMGVIFGVLFAMVLFSYLNTPRSVSMLHSFPIRREGLFLTNYLTGLLVAVSGPGISILLTIMVQLASNTLNGYAVGMGLLCALLPIIFFYSFAVFCAMLTGQILAIPVFYGIFNFFAAGIYFLIQQFATAFYFGFTTSDIPAWVEWLTPIYHMSQKARYYSRSLDGITNGTYQVDGVSTLAAYAVAGLVLAALALVIYRRRKSESAGDVVAIRWAKPLFRYGVAASAAPGLGQLIYYALWAEFSGSNVTNIPVMIFCTILMGWLGYYVAEMLLKKSFRVFRSGLRGAAGLTAGLVIFSLAMAFDVLGVESRMPALSEVDSISMAFYGHTSIRGELNSEKDMQLIQDIQQALLAEKGTLQRWEIEDTDASLSVTIRYYMKDLSSIYRSYNFSYNESQVAENPALSLLTQMASSPALQQAANDLPDLDRFTGGDLFSLPQNKFGDSYQKDDYEILTAAQAQTLYDAFLRDIDAGHVGKNVLFPSLWSEETYVNQLNLYYQSTVKDEYDDGTRSFTIEFSVHCTELIAALEEMGLITAEHPLLTYSQRDAMFSSTDVYDSDYLSEYGYSEAADYEDTSTRTTAEVMNVPVVPVG